MYIYFNIKRHHTGQISIQFNLNLTHSILVRQI